MRTRTNLVRDLIREALGKSGVRRSHRVGRTVPAERHESKNELLRSAQADAFLLPCPRKVLESYKKIILSKIKTPRKVVLDNPFVSVCLTVFFFANSHGRKG